MISLFILCFHLPIPEPKKLCEMCMHYGEVTFALARQGASYEEIAAKATAKCNSPSLPDSLRAPCRKFVSVGLNDAIRMAKTTRASAHDYCVSKHIC